MASPKRRSGTTKRRVAPKTTPRRATGKPKRTRRNNDKVTAARRELMRVVRTTIGKPQEERDRIMKEHRAKHGIPSPARKAPRRKASPRLEHKSASPMNNSASPMKKSASPKRKSAFPKRKSASPKRKSPMRKSASPTKKRTTRRK